MSNPVFPLPQRPRLDLKIEPQDTRVRSNVDAGPPRMRARFTAGLTTWTFTLPTISGTEWASLLYFYKTTLSQGTTPFDWPDEFGVVLAWRFAAPPTAQPVKSHHLPTKRAYDVSLVLEALP